MNGWNEKGGGLESRQLSGRAEQWWDFHVRLVPSAGHFGNVPSELNVVRLFTCYISSIRKVSLMSPKLGFEALQCLIIESEPHGVKCRNWNWKSGLSESKAHTLLLWRLTLVYSPIDFQLLQHHLLKSISFLYWVAFTSLLKLIWAYLYWSIFGFSIDLSIHQYHTDYCSFIINLQINRSILPLYSSFSKSSSFLFTSLHINFRIVLPMCTKKFLLGVWWELHKMYLYVEWIFTVLTFPFYKWYVHPFLYIFDQHFVVFSMQVVLYTFC